MREFYKAFNEAFFALKENYSKNKKYLKDKRLTKAEAKILKAYTDLRFNKYQDIFETLPQMTSSSDYFEAHRNLILGLAYNNTGKYEKALNHFNDAQDYFEPDKDQEYMFHLYTNWYYLSINLNDDSMSKEIINELSKIDVKDKRDALIKKLLTFEFSSRTGHKDEALLQFDEIRENEKDFLPHDKSAYHTIAFNFFVYQSDFQNAHKELSKLRMIKNYQLTENYKYIKSLLDYIINDKSIYARFLDFERTKILGNEIMCIKSLSYGDYDEANGYWKSLMHAKPKVYLDNFQVNSSKNLFYHALRKALSNSSRKIELYFDSKLSINQRITLIFKQYPIILKSDLFKLLYEREMTKLGDGNKLSQAISRYKKKHNIIIKTHHDSYELIADKKAA